MPYQLTLAIIYKSTFLTCGSLIRSAAEQMLVHSRGYCAAMRFSADSVTSDSFSLYDSAQKQTLIFSLYGPSVSFFALVVVRSWRSGYALLRTSSLVHNSLCLDFLASFLSSHLKHLNFQRPKFDSVKKPLP